MQIVHVKGDRKAERMILRMNHAGYRLENQTTRKAVWSWLAGIFTRKQIHTLTFVKDPDLPDLRKHGPVFVGGRPVKKPS